MRRRCAARAHHRLLEAASMGAMAGLMLPNGLRSIEALAMSCI